jgi:hypothetical protein
MHIDRGFEMRHVGMRTHLCNCVNTESEAQQGMQTKKQQALWQRKPTSRRTSCSSRSSCRPVRPASLGHKRAQLAVSLGQRALQTIKAVGHLHRRGR